MTTKPSEEKSVSTVRVTVRYIILLETHTKRGDNKSGRSHDGATCLTSWRQLRSRSTSEEPILTFIRLKDVHRVSNLQRQLLLSSGIVVIDRWGKKKKLRGDNMRGGDITGGGKKAIKCLAPSWR